MIAAAEPEQQISGAQDPVVELVAGYPVASQKASTATIPSASRSDGGTPTASQPNAIASAESLRENRISSTSNGGPNR